MSKIYIFLAGCVAGAIVTIGSICYAQSENAIEDLEDEAKTEKEEDFAEAQEV